MGNCGGWVQRKLFRKKSHNKCNDWQTGCIIVVVIIIILLLFLLLVVLVEVGRIKHKRQKYVCNGEALHYLLCLCMSSGLYKQRLPLLLQEAGVGSWGAVIVTEPTTAHCPIWHGVFFYWVTWWSSCTYFDCVFLCVIKKVSYSIKCIYSNLQIVGDTPYFPSGEGELNRRWIQWKDRGF